MVVNRTMQRWPLVLALMALGLASFGVYKVKELEDEMRAGDEVSSYSLHLDNGTHLIHVQTKWNEEDSEIWLRATSSWPSGVPEEWRPVMPNAKSIRWTATVNCKESQWMLTSYDTYMGLGGNGRKPAITDIWNRTMRPFSDSRSKVYAPLLDYVCGVSS